MVCRGGARERERERELGGGDGPVVRPRRRGVQARFEAAYHEGLLGPHAQEEAAEQVRRREDVHDSHARRFEVSPLPGSLGVAGFS